MIRIFRSVAILLVVLVCAAVAQDLLSSQPSLWADKPDAAAFEKIENDRLTAAQHSIDAIVAVKGARTIENTLAPYDQAVERIDAASHFADLMQNVHPDTAFRDRATAMVTKVSAANTALSLNRKVYKALADIGCVHGRCGHPILRTAPIAGVSARWGRQGRCYPRATETT